MVGLLNYVVGFVVSLLVGAFGIYVGARVIVDRDDFDYAILTAIVGAVVWWVVAGLFGLIPVVGSAIGSIFGLLAWLWVLNARYPGGWGNAIGIGLVAWVSVWAVLLVFETLGFISAGALGVPGL